MKRHVTQKELREAGAASRARSAARLLARPKEEETAAEDIRNALQLVRTLPGGLAYQQPDLEAIERLLRSALEKLSQP